jgi:cob(I)alamin adenosyltransferase
VNPAIDSVPKSRATMGNRLTKIYTRTGDDGTTGLGDGSRTEKDSLRVETFGSVDEVNSLLGVILGNALPAAAREVLSSIQNTLFDLGGELCIPAHRMVTADHVTALETAVDRFNAELTPLEEFVLPRGTRAAAECHLARAVTRRAERQTVALARVEDVNPEALRYLNRLSDLLFVLARWINKQAGVTEVLWRHS